MTSTGLQYAIEQHTRLEIDVILYAPHIVIPYGGKFEDLQNVLVVDLGQIKIYSSGERASILEVCTSQENIFHPFLFKNISLGQTTLQWGIRTRGNIWKNEIMQLRQLQNGADRLANSGGSRRRELEAIHWALRLYGNAFAEALQLKYSVLSMSYYGRSEVSVTENFDFAKIVFLNYVLHFLWFLFYFVLNANTIKTSCFLLRV